MPSYPYRSGNPTEDNRARRMNRALHKQLRHFRVETPQGRRRKKQILRVEGATYLKLVHEAAMALMAERR